MIEGLRQAVLYGSSSHRLFFHLRKDGSDVTSASSAKITIYDPSGNELVAETDLTQVGSTAVWYYDLDASATATYEKAVDYRATLNFTPTGGQATEEHVFFDVAAYPFGEPLITSEEVANMRPGWEFPEDWSDWTQAIEDAHARLYTDLRNMRDNKGDPVYPFRLIDRQQLRRAAIAYTFREVADVIRLTDEEKADVRSAAEGVIPTLITIDRDDDMLIEDDEEGALEITFVR